MVSKMMLGIALCVLPALAHDCYESTHTLTLAEGVQEIVFESEVDMTYDLINNVSSVNPTFDYFSYDPAAGLISESTVDSQWLISLAAGNVPIVHTGSSIVGGDSFSNTANNIICSLPVFGAMVGVLAECVQSAHVSLELEWGWVVSEYSSTRLVLNFIGCDPGFAFDENGVCYDINECEGVNCNNGNCVDQVNAYSCSCDDGYDGDHCENNINECEGVNCNNGNCVDQVNAYYCSCDAGYDGDHCEIDINECEGVNCNNGNCVDQVNAYSCSCDAGYDGNHCENNINECEGVNCNNGNCVDQVNAYYCSCDAGYDGDHCENNINECAGVNCNNGNCVDQVNAYYCSCDAGYDGAHCENNINECAGVNCNNGNCVDGVNSYTCSCDSGWTGSHCDVYATSCLALKNAGFTSNGYYNIQPPGYGAVQVYCDMSMGYDFKYVTGAINHYRSTDHNTCKNYGLDIWIPRSQHHWQRAYSFWTIANSGVAKSTFMQPMGITRPWNGCGSCTGTAMNRDAVNAVNGGWRAHDGGNFWVRSTPMSEPNGDYNANCYLGLWNDGSLDANMGGISFNDGSCGYSSGTQYLCSTNAVNP
jgi:hypothetical protein